MKLIIAAVLLAMLAACGDKGWYTPSTIVEVTRKGCSVKDQNAQVFLSITSERTSNGQMHCVIDTVPEAK